MSVTVQAPTKANLRLGFGGIRPDGFHELSNVFHAVSRYDTVTVSQPPELRVAAALSLRPEPAGTLRLGELLAASGAFRAVSTAFGPVPGAVLPASGAGRVPSYFGKGAA